MVCHAGPGVGLGHISRSLVIADGLREKSGCEISLIVQGAEKTDERTNKKLEGYRYSFISFDANLQNAFEDHRMIDPVDAVIFDLNSKYIPADFTEALSDMKRQGIKLIAIDGMLPWHEILDLIFIPSFYFADRNSEFKAKIAYGWDCYLIDVGQPAQWQPGDNVLVLTGGSDEMGLGRTWPDYLDKTLDHRVVLNWVTGLYSSPPKFPDSPRINFQEYRNITNLTPLMDEANYASTIYGVSFFELLAKGIPTVVFSPYGTKDSSQLMEIANFGIALIAENEDEAAEKLKWLMQNDQHASSMSRKASELPLRGGIRRFCNELGNIL